MSGAAHSFGRTLRELRTQKGWSQQELAERAGLSVNAISAFERAERFPRAGTIDQLTSAFGSDALHAPLALEVRDQLPPTYAPEHEGGHSLGALVELLRGEPEQTIGLVFNIARLIINERVTQPAKTPRDRTCARRRPHAKITLAPRRAPPARSSHR